MVDNYQRYTLILAVPIKSFKCPDTENFFHGHRLRR